MSTKQKKRVSFNVENKENTGGKEDKGNLKSNARTIQISEIKCDINFIVIKYNAFLKTIEKDAVFAKSNLDKHQCDYDYDLQKNYASVNEHTAVVEEMISGLEYELVLLEQKKDYDIQKMKESNKILIEKRNKDLDFHKIKVNKEVADCYYGLMFHKVLNYTKILKLYSDLHKDMSDELSQIQRLFDDSGCKLRKEWQKYLTPFINQMYEVFQTKEKYEQTLNNFNLEKDKSRENYNYHLKMYMDYK
jgi:hypothetical protein